MTDYLFYVRFALSGLRVFHCKTEDPFHVMGEMHYRCDEHIERLDFTLQTDGKLDYWKREGITIKEWTNKYNYKK